MRVLYTTITKMVNTWTSKNKLFLLLGSGVLGACGFAVYKFWKHRESKSIDEGFEDVSRIEEIPEKRILVLGLESSGKSTIVAQITSDVPVIKDLKPTEGFNVTCLQGKNITLKIWEIGGGDSVRPYWTNFLQDTDLLVFVVDAADEHGLPQAVREVKTLLGDERLAHVPVLILANKQDLPGVKNPDQVAEILDLNSIPRSKHKVKVLGTTAVQLQAIEKHESMTKVKNALLSMCYE